MSDSNRLEVDIVVNDDSKPGLDKARANYRSFEEEVVRSARGISNSTDRVGVEFARSLETATGKSMRSLERLEARAAAVGKSAVEKLVLQRNAMIGNLGADEAAIQRAVAAYDRLITAQRKYDDDRRRRHQEEEGSGSHAARRRAVLGIKDLTEGRSNAALIELFDVLLGTSGSSGILSGGLSKLGTGMIAGLAAGGTVAAIGILAKEMFNLVEPEARAAKELEHFAAQLGLTVNQASVLSAEAKLSGTNIDSLGSAARRLSQAIEDPAGTGKKTAVALREMGIATYDASGKQRELGQVTLDVIEKLSQYPTAAERAFRSSEVFGREGFRQIQLMIEQHQQLKQVVSNMGYGNVDQLESELAKADDQINQLTLAWQMFRKELAAEVAPIIIPILREITTVFVGDKAERVQPGTEIYPGITASHDYKERQLQVDLVDAVRHNTDAALTRSQAAAGAAQQTITDSIVNDYLQGRGRNGDMKERLDAAKKNLTEAAGKLQNPTGLSPQAARQAVADAERYGKEVSQIEASIKSLTANAENLLAARKEALALDSRFAGLREADQLKDIEVRTGKNPFSSSDVATMLDLAKQRVGREQQQAVNERRYRVGEHGEILDLSGTKEFQSFVAGEAANFPKRLRNEYEQEMSKIEAHDAQYFAQQREQMGKLWEEQLTQRRKQEQQLWDDVQRMEESATQRYYQMQESANNRGRDLALQQLGLVDAQTLKEKEALEERKFQIEAYYALRSTQLQIDKLSHDETYALGELRKKYPNVPEDNPDYMRERQLISGQYEDQKAELARATNDKILVDAQASTNKRVEYEVQENRRVFESLKHDADGLFDALFTKTKSWGDFFKDLFKATILTPVKEVFSSQVAGFFTELLTGKKVSFSEIGNGQGAFGKLGSIFGRAGLGQPRFGDANHPLAKLDQPNHLGDVSLVQGAVPVVIMNAGQAAQQGHQAVAQSSGGGFSLGPIAAGFGLGSLFARGAAASPIESVSSAISYATGGGATFAPELSGGGPPAVITDLFGNALPSAPAFPTSGGSGIFGSLGNLLGGPGGTSGFAGPVGSSGGLTDPFGNALPTPPPYTGADAGPASAGFGGLAGAGLTVAGLALAKDGWSRGGGKGALEMAGGGAAIGYQFGGPLGAAVGALAGLEIGVIKWAFFESDTDHAKKLVKQVYGMSINDSMAGQIVQIAKQKYNSQIDVAVRSQEVRDLLRLYAQTLGDTKAQAQFVADKPHSGSLVESNGKLFQNAVSDNGLAYSYSSPLSVYGGAQTTPLPTYGPMSGGPSSVQLIVNGQAASDLLAGQVANVATPGFVQAKSLAASQSSIGRNTQTALTIAPSAISR